MDKTDFASERSHQDVKSAGEFARMALQYAVISNGGAATAIITLIGAVKDQRLSMTMPFALFFYLLGVYHGLKSTYDFYVSQNNYGTMWEYRALRNDDDDSIGMTEFRRATKLREQAGENLENSIKSFLFASLLAALILFAVFFLFK